MKYKTTIIFSFIFLFQGFAIGQINIDSLVTVLDSTYIKKRLSSTRIGYFDSDTLEKYNLITAYNKDYFSKDVLHGIYLIKYEYQEGKLLSEKKHYTKDGHLFKQQKDAEKPFPSIVRYEYLKNKTNHTSTRIIRYFDQDGEIIPALPKREEDKGSNKTILEIRYYNEANELSKVFKLKEFGEKKVLVYPYDKNYNKTYPNNIGMISFEFETKNKKHLKEIRYYDKNYKLFNPKGSKKKYAIITYSYIPERDEVVLKFFNRKGKFMGAKHYYYFKGDTGTSININSMW